MNKSPDLSLSDVRFSELRLFARLVNTLALITGLLYLRVFILETVPVLARAGQMVQGVASVFFLVAAILGLVVAWRHEWAGGWLAIVGGLGLGILTFATTPEPSPWLTTFFYSSPFIATGLVTLACWRRSKTR